MRWIAIFAAALTLAGIGVAPLAAAETLSLRAVAAAQPLATSPVTQQYRYRHRVYRPGYRTAWRVRYNRPRYHSWRSRHYRPRYGYSSYRYRGHRRNPGWHRGWRR